MGRKKKVVAETWTTAFLCQKCFPPTRNYCQGQDWGTSKNGQKEYRMSCLLCGWTDITLEAWRNGFHDQ